MKNVLAAFAFAMLIAGSVQAQGLPAVDPTTILSQPRQIALQGCGFSIATNADWRHTVERESSTVVVHNIGLAANAKSIGYPLAEITVSAISTMEIRCEVSEGGTENGRRAYVETLAQGMLDSWRGSAEFSSFSGLQRVAAGSLSNGRAFFARKNPTQNGGVVVTGEAGWLFGNVGNVRVSIFSQVNDSRPPAGSSRIPAGSDILHDLGRGQLLAGRFTVDAYQAPSGALWPVRSPAADRAIIAQIWTTIR